MDGSIIRLERDDPPANATLDPVVNEAIRRWKRCSEWEAQPRQRFFEDLKFRHADSDNGYQWPNEIRLARDTASKPCLTMNIIRQHNLIITNQMRKNKTSVKFMGEGGEATAETALAMRDIVRRIEGQSYAQDHYTLARNFQVDGGIGYIRLSTDYADQKTFDQEIFIDPVPDPLAVYYDPEIKHKTGRDAEWCIVIDMMTKEDFREAYPEYEGSIGLSPLGQGTIDDVWVEEHHVVIAEYFRKVKKPDKLYSFTHRGERHHVRAKALTREHETQIARDPQTMMRTVFDTEVEHYIIVGQKIVDKTIWPGQFIPIIRVVGEETVIGGLLDRKGHTRAMKDAQRMYNYNASAQVEQVALQGKTPWIAASKAIEEFESMWNTANTANHSVMIWNHVDDNGEKVPPPERIDPPKESSAFQQGMETAFNQMMMTSGQFQNQLGMMGNERTGAAIKGRQEQSDTAVFHFQDNFESALMFLGEQLIDLIPRIYDTKRIMTVEAEDGSSYTLELDPTARQAFVQRLGHQNEVAHRIMNLQKLKFQVSPTIGAAYSSKRQEAIEGLTMLVSERPELATILGDLLVGCMDFDKAQEAAARLKRMVPPQALGTGPSQQEQQLQSQLATAQRALADALQKLADKQLKLVGKDQMRDIDVYKANTDRLAILAKAGIDPSELKQVAMQAVQDAFQTHIQSVVQANANDIDPTPSGDQTEGAGTDGSENDPGIAGAKRAPDGHYYVPDPGRAGGWMHVERKSGAGAKSNG